MVQGLRVFIMDSQKIKPLKNCVKSVSTKQDLTDRWNGWRERPLV